MAVVILHGKALRITNSEFVFVAQFIQHAMRMRRNTLLICDLPRYTIFFPHYLINGTIFEKKATEHKMCVLTFCTAFV